MKRYQPIIFLLFPAVILILEGSCSADNPSQPNLQGAISSKLDLGDPYVEQTAVTMARDYPGEFSINQVGAIYDTLVQGWNYYSDPSYKELYKNANLTLQEGMGADTVGVGDCDDFAILISSLIDSLGGSTRIIFAYDEASRQGHAYAELYLGKKDSPMIKDLEGWTKDEYGKPSVPGMRLTGDEVWLNLDYNGTYPGGPFFGEKWVRRTVAWESENKTFPKIVPLIDPMEDLSNWKTLKDELGSNVSISLVPSKKGRAINLTYDLKDNGWVGISRDVEPQLLAELQGLNISYRMTGKQSTLEIRLEDQNGTVFGSSRILNGGPPRWACLEALFDGFTEINQRSEEKSLLKVLEPFRIRKLEFIMRNTTQNGDVPGPGSISLDQIRGVMRVSNDSPWARAKDLRDDKAALDLASKSQMVLESKSTDSLTKSVLLAVESLRHKQTLQGNMAIYHGLVLLPRFIAKLEHNDWVNAMAFSPDGTRLATASGNTTYVWDAETGSQLQRLEHDSYVFVVAFSPDGKTLAMGSNDTTARLWDVQTGKELHRLQHDVVDYFGSSSNGLVYIIAFSPDSKTLAIGSDDNTARLWDVQTGKQLQKLEHDDRLNAVVFSPDGKTLATGSNDNTARLWDVQTGKQLQKLEHDNAVNPMFLELDNGTDSNKQQMTLEFNNAVHAVAFSPDGTKLATASEDSTARIWDAKTGKELHRLEHDGSVGAVAFSPDGTELATTSTDKTDRIWDANTGKELWRKEHGGRIGFVAFILDGTKWATASSDKTASIWDIKTGKEMLRLEHNSGMNDMVLSPDGTKLATASKDNAARIWDIKMGDVLKKLVHDDPVYTVAFSPNGAKVAAASGDNAAHIWDVETSKELHRLKHDNYVTAVAFSPDGRDLATASWDKTARLWDAQTSGELLRLEHDGQVHDVAFSPDGKTLATASDDKTARTVGCPDR
jgi:WD40 repeat protein